VENEDQLHFLAAHGCGLIQGYLTGRPLLPEDAIELLKSGKPLTVPAMDSQQRV
jgi:EAL domain-containing protein (putative c-di-GMP-specific phosphodiesterase class I)